MKEQYFVKCLPLWVWVCLCFYGLGSIPTIQAQQLFFEDFNDCTIPTNWSSNSSGNPNPVFGIGIPNNPEIENKGGYSTIDGTCLMYFDDNITGYNTMGWTASYSSPAFDASALGAGNDAIVLEMDLQFYSGGDSNLKVYVFDGTNYQQIKEYKWNWVYGDTYDEYIHIAYDVSQYANPNMRIKIQYSDGNTNGWWGGVDNILVTRNTICENFDTCDVLPTGWTSTAENGTATWQFGEDDDRWSHTMNQSCMAYFNDDILGETAAPSKVTLTSPAFDATFNANVFLDVDVMYRDENNSSLSISVFDGNSFVVIANYAGANVGGWSYVENEHVYLDLSPYRNQDMQVAFTFDDAGNKGAWTSIDNFKIRGWGAISDICTRAINVPLNDDCVATINNNAVFMGPQPACVDSSSAAIWYKFTAPASGDVTISTASDFNDVLTLFEGTCSSLNPIACVNRDEHGFIGETLPYSGLTPGQTYFVRVSGVLCGFGASEGNVCMQVTSTATTPTPPSNDDCANAEVLTIDGACITGSNIHATAETNESIPSLNNRAKASVWYQFTAPTSGEVLLDTKADFADVITVYEGACGMFAEVACADYGHSLHLTGLSSGQTYWIQVAGYFATIEGDFCISATTPPTAASNDLCGNAININVDEACTNSNNAFATISSPLPSCDVYPKADIWFKFTAPTSGKVSIIADADFVYVMSIYSGTCGTLQETNCFLNPSPCEGAVTASNLIAGNVYYLQIASASNPFGYTEGAVCVEIKTYANDPVKAKIQVLLQGPYQGNGSMSQILNTNHLVPASQPYYNAPWNYSGRDCVASIPADMVDWVLLELRDAADNNVLIEQKAALLLTNGWIVDDGQDGVFFSNAIENNSYYVVVRHRNHLDIMSSVAVPLPNMNPYDFSNDPSYVMGGAAQVADTGDGKYTMITGDMNGDGIITVSDYNWYINEVSLINKYLDADCNLDRVVTVADFNIYQPNASFIGIPQVRY